MVPPPSPKKHISGLPEISNNVSSKDGLITSSPYYHDIHMETAKGLPSIQSYSDIRMGTAKSPQGATDDIYMETARGGTTMKQQSGFQVWERELLESSEVRRKATVAQLCA